MRTFYLQHHIVLQATLYLVLVVFHHFPDIGFDTGELQSATFDVGEFQQLVDEVEQLLAIGIDLAEHLMAVLCRDIALALIQHLAETDDGIQRRA